MALRERTLLGKRDRVEEAIEFLRELEDYALQLSSDGFWLAFSGGKDSVVILDLAKRAGIPFSAHYNVTTVDPPELVYFIKEFHPEVKFERPIKNMWELIRWKGMPPTRRVRYCCSFLKERGGDGCLVLTDIRHEESAQRSSRTQVEGCRTGPKKVYARPIIEWTEGDVWEYIKKRELPYCSLYDEGFRRVG